MRGAAAMVVALLLGGCGGEPPAAPTYNLVLDAQGVVFVGSDATYARFPFGTPKADVERAAAAVYGDAKARRTNSAECGAGPMAFTSYGAIQLGFQRDRLVGWTMRRAAAGAGEGGIAPGITRMQLDRLAAIRMMPDPAVPGEFVYRTPTGPIRGVLAGRGPQARVEALFAGTACAANRPDPPTSSASSQNGTFAG